MNQFEGEASSAPIEYEPVNVKDVLVEMKDTAELLIDLSYSAVLLSSEEIAEEVLRLEERMDVLEMRARMGLMMAVRSPEDAEQLAPVLGIVTAADDISDAAGDIAKVVLEDIGLPEAMRAALPEAVETLVRGVVNTNSEYAGQTLEEIDLESETGVRVIALRRGDDWLLNPGPTTRIEADDVALLRGPDVVIGDVYESLTGTAYEPPVAESPDIDDLERAVDTIVHMKNLSELAVDLAYSAVLFDSDALAEEVRNLEVEVDALESRFEAWTLRAAADASDPVSLRGLIHLGSATEVISDAAVDISEGVLRNIDVHPVVQMAVEESDEIITRVEVESNSDLDGTAITAGVPDTESTMSVIAIRRPEEGWVLVGDADAEVRGGDILISKGTRTAATAFEELAVA
ncbi:potassium channel protein [Natronorubrum sp. JWXQ-INN-674]|uniref:Potassium channel protein n=1 Tax=Natronorubrum halalkaliphilum TaxID=2691917 RepID=A0A6B0VJW2_9EURY|nr:potassium channel family protein [Natronorubrum halalkaliphilum]MXV62111.1 potassium channel protein [Natronorubrum halalkaliphilum]